MKQSQGQRILELLRKSPDKRVTCGELASHYLYHKASTRIGELERKGHIIPFTPGENWDNGFYTLEFDAGQNQREDRPTLKSIEFFEQEGQGCFK